MKPVCLQEPQQAGAASTEPLARGQGLGGLPGTSQQQQGRAAGLGDFQGSPQHPWAACSSASPPSG